MANTDVISLIDVWVRSPAYIPVLMVCVLTTHELLSAYQWGCVFIHRQNVWCLPACACVTSITVCGTKSHIFRFTNQPASLLRHFLFHNRWQLVRKSTFVVFLSHATNNCFCSKLDRYLRFAPLPHTLHFSESECRCNLVKRALPIISIILNEYPVACVCVFFF